MADNKVSEITVSQEVDKPSYVVGGPITLTAVNSSGSPSSNPNILNKNIKAPVRDSLNKKGPIHLQDFEFSPETTNVSETSVDFTRQPMQMALIRFKYEQPNWIRVQFKPVASSEPDTRPGHTGQQIGFGVLVRRTASDSDGVAFAEYQYDPSTFGNYMPPIKDPGTALKPLQENDILVAARKTTSAGSISVKVRYAYYDFQQNTVTKELPANFPSPDSTISKADYYSCTGHRPEKIVENEVVTCVEQFTSPLKITLTIGSSSTDYNGYYGAGKRYEYKITDANDNLMPGVWLQERFVTKDPDFPSLTLQVPGNDFAINPNGTCWVLGEASTMQYDYVTWGATTEYKESGNPSPWKYFVHQYWLGSASISNGTPKGTHWATYRMKLWTDKVVHEKTTNK